MPVVPPPRCERAGCQKEECVASGSPIKTLDCSKIVPDYKNECLNSAICDIGGDGTCGWQKTDAYLKCLATPEQTVKQCSILDACKCSSNPACQWCISDVTIKPLAARTSVDVSYGICLPKDNSYRCIAPKPLGGLEGKMVQPFTCDITTKPPIDPDFTTLLQTKDPVQLNTKIPLLANNDPAIAGFKILVTTVIAPEPREIKTPTDTGKGGVARTVVDISPKPTDTEIPKLCDFLTKCLLDSSKYEAVRCQLDEVVGAPGTPTPSVKRQASTSGSYLHQVSASESLSSSNGSASLQAYGFGLIIAGAVLISALI